MEFHEKKSNFLKTFEKICYSKLYNNYSTSLTNFNKLIISNIIYNNKLHIVSSFKEFLIYYDPGDFLAQFYKKKESRKKLKTYCEFYTLNSRIFPNYTLLPESKYIFNNIKKKQKLLDILEENYNLNNNESSRYVIRNYSDINNNNRSLQLNRTQSSYLSTIFTPSIVNSILNEKDNSSKNNDNSNISNINFIIDNINKNQKKNNKLLIYKTPKNKNIFNKNNINNDSGIFKKSTSSLDIYLNNNNKINNSSKKNPNKNSLIPNYNKEKEKEKNKKKINKDKFIGLEFSNNEYKKSIKNSRQQNAPKKFKNTNIHKKTQSNENIRNDMGVFQDNETINNKISMLLKTNCDIKSIANNIYSDNNKNLNKNKKNNNLQRYIQHITKNSKDIKKNINKTSFKNNKMSLKKSTTSKNNTTYTNKTQSQPSISYRHKNVSTITKSMPKLPTSFANKKKIKNSKNSLQNQLFNFPSGYQSLKNTNINYNSNFNSKKSKNKSSNHKNSYKMTKYIKDKSLNNFYQIVQKNIDNNIKYNIYNIKNNYKSNSKSKLPNATKNKNKKNSIVPSLHISLGNIINNNTFIKACNQSISKSKSKSRSKSKSINKSNSIIKILDENNKLNLQLNKNLDEINKIKIDNNKNVHKAHDGLQTERTKSNFKGGKMNNIPKISFEVNLNNINMKKISETKTTINNYKYSNINTNTKIYDSKKNEHLHLNLKGNIGNKNYNINKKFPQSARNQNNINNLNNNKNSNFCSETELINQQNKPTTHRVINKFKYPNKNNKNKISENQREILSPKTKNKNIYLIHNYNINEVNNNINFFSQQNIKSKRNSVNQEQGTNIIININNNIFQNNKNNFNYNNYIYNSSGNNNCMSNKYKKNNNKNSIKDNMNVKSNKNYKYNKQNFKI